MCIAAVAAASHDRKKEIARASSATPAAVATRPLRVALVGSTCDASHVIKPSGSWQAGDSYVLGGSGRVLARPHEAVSVRQGLEARGVSMVVNASEDVEAAVHAARQADVVVACAYSTASEAIDRPHLKLKQHDFLVRLGLDAG